MRKRSFLTLTEKLKLKSSLRCRCLCCPLLAGCSLKEPPLMKGCWEPNLKLREAQRLFEDQLIGPESIANIGGQSVVLVTSSSSSSCDLESVSGSDSTWNKELTDVLLFVCRCVILWNSWRENREADWSKNRHGDETRKTDMWWENTRTSNTDCVHREVWFKFLFKKVTGLIFSEFLKLLTSWL